MFGHTYSVTTRRPYIDKYDVWNWDAENEKKALSRSVTHTIYTPNKNENTDILFMGFNEQTEARLLDSVLFFPDYKRSMNSLECQKCQIPIAIETAAASTQETYPRFKCSRFLCINECVKCHEKINNLKSTLSLEYILGKKYRLCGDNECLKIKKCNYCAITNVKFIYDGDIPYCQACSNERAFSKNTDVQRVDTCRDCGKCVAIKTRYIGFWFRCGDCYHDYKKKMTVKNISKAQEDIILERKNIDLAEKKLMMENNKEKYLKMSEYTYKRAKYN